MWVDILIDGFARYFAPEGDAVWSTQGLSAVTGSASGGLQIFMQTMAPAYLEMGIPPGVLHRVATMASGGFDSLPHCGAVVALFW